MSDYKVILQSHNNELQELVDMANELPDKVEGIDTSDATATASHILEGETAYVNGEKITGNIPTVEQATPTISVDSAGKITASATQTAGYVIAGTKNTTQQLTVQGATTITPSTSEQIAINAGTYASGDIKVGAMPTATQATPTINVDSAGKITASSTQTTGYVSAGTKTATKQLTVQAAQTITPGTSNKTIASGTYLTGTQTIAGDADLVATNIKKGVNIFGVVGSYDAVSAALNFNVVGGIGRPYSLVDHNDFRQVQYTTATVSGNSITVKSTQGTYQGIIFPKYPASAGEIWNFSADVDSGYTTSYIKLGIKGYNSNGTVLNDNKIVASASISNNKLSFSYTVPSGTAYVELMILVSDGGSSTHGTSTYRNIKAGVSANVATENTVWVNTNKEIKSWAFSSTEPALISSNKNVITYPYDNTTKTISGITFTDNGDGTVTAKGTATSNAYFEFRTKANAILLQPGTYTLSGNANSSCRIGVVYSYDNFVSHNSSNEISSNQTFTLTQQAYVRFNCKVPSGVTVNSVVFKPQFEQGSSATSFIKGNAEGQVWISTGASSSVDFNALKSNAIQVYPMSAKQYINNAWVSKDIQVYLNGKWNDVKAVADFSYDGTYITTTDAEGNWEIHLQTSGTFKFNNLNSATKGIEVFLVGGGGNGAKGAQDGQGGGGGGGGGYTATTTLIPIQGQNYPIVIGGSAGATSGFGAVANAGSNGTQPGYLSVNGGAGGAGTGNGGAGANGGSGKGGDGGNGVYAFGGTSGTRYGGGGGGSCGSQSTGGGGKGGASGGGAGGSTSSASGSAGVANTGGGGGGGYHAGSNGGSGIIIIRNKRG